MKIIGLIFSLLLITGLFQLFDITLQKIIIDLRSLISEARRYYRKRKYAKRIPIKKQVELITGEKKVNFIVKNFNDARNILFSSRQSKKMRTVYLASVAGGCSSVIISAVLKNIFILPPLAVGLALIPAWSVKIMEARFIRNINDELETALSCITASYMRTDNIVLAVEENLGVLNPPVNQAFMFFYNENKLINSNVIYGLTKLKKSFESTIFAEWCDAVIQCQSDRTLKATLYPIVQKFTDVKRVQAELDTSMMLPMQNFIVMTVVLLLMIPVMASMQPGWLDILINTVGGKILLSLTVVAVIFGINKAINLSRPIEYKK
mgnify:CR=1 FL=1